MSKVIWDCVGFALLRSMIGSENSRYSLNRSDVKLKPMTTLSRAFSRALRSLLVSFLVLIGSLGILSFLMGRSENFGFCFTKIICNALKLLKLTKLNTHDSD